MRRYRSVGLRPPLPRRTLDYLAHGADEGRRNAELFDAACQFRDASIAPEEAETQLIARATLDGLSEAEARTAIRSAFNHTPREPVGIGAPMPLSKSNGTAPRREPKLHRDAPPLSPVALPEPVAGGFAALVDACFGPAEFVAIAPAPAVFCGRRPELEILLRASLAACVRARRQDHHLYPQRPAQRHPRHARPSRRNPHRSCASAAADPSGNKFQ